MAYGKKRRNGRSHAPRRTETAAPAEPSGAMALLRQQTTEIEANAGRQGSFAPKPRAIRKYERFANMGE